MDKDKFTSNLEKGLSGQKEHFKFWPQDATEKPVMLKTKRSALDLHRFNLLFLMRRMSTAIFHERPDSSLHCLLRIIFPGNL